MSNEQSVKRAKLLLRVFTLATLALLMVSLALTATGIEALAQAKRGGGQAPLGHAPLRKALAYLGAGLATGLAGIGGGYAVGQAGAAMIAALTEKPEMFGRMFIILVLGEGIALYGLLISILLMFAVG